MGNLIKNGKQIAVYIRVDEKLRKDFEALAEKEDRTLSGLARAAIKQYISIHK